jgi:HAMP domain-containing protein
MAIFQAVRRSLGVKVSLKLAVLVVALTVLAAFVIVRGQTRQLEALTLEKARGAAMMGARQYGDVLDAAIDSGLLTVADVFDRRYEPIAGHDFGDRPKYHTRFDALTDRAVLVFQDEMLEHADFVFAVGVDENGYLPTHNTRYQRPLTGDPSKDLAGNRTKRIFDDPVGLAAAKSTAPSLAQVYRRDTGETMWDVSAPIRVKGKHWGGFRVAVSMERIEAQKRALLLTLAGLFGAFTLVTVAAMFVVVRQAMRPVVALTEAAQRISLGEALEEPIKPRSEDEIGQLTKTIDRLRASMKAAMARLGH